jgi:hypothetical protein
MVLAAQRTIVFANARVGEIAFTGLIGIASREDGNMHKGAPAFMP